MVKNTAKKIIEKANDWKTVHILRVITFSVFMIFLILTLPSVNAVGLSVNKAVIDFNNVLMGGYAEDYVNVASDADFDIPLSYEVTGDLQGWITIEPDMNTTEIYISKTRGELLKIMVRPPADTPVGIYTGGVRVITGSINKPGGTYGSQLQAAFLIRITVSVTGDQIIACGAGGANIPDIEVGKPIEISVSVSNSGNVRITPNVSIDVWNQDQTTLVMSRFSDFNKVDILPTTVRNLLARFDNNLRIGQYWAYVSVAPCGDSQLLSFSVLDKGEISDYGELVRIENPAWVNTGDVVPITAIFRNTGSRVVSAKLKGIITKDERIVQNLDSEFYDVNPGETGNIQVFYTPTEPGVYTISGRILYNNKLSFEKSSILNVNGEITEFNWFYVLILIIIIIIILALLISIKRRRKRMHRI